MPAWVDLLHSILLNLWWYFLFWFAKGACKNVVAPTYFGLIMLHVVIIDIGGRWFVWEFITSHNSILLCFILCKVMVIASYYWDFCFYLITKYVIVFSTTCKLASYYWVTSLRVQSLTCSYYFDLSLSLINQFICCILYLGWCLLICIGVDQNFSLHLSNIHSLI